jgi:solute carrier family 25 citrate transporter 1
MAATSTIATAPQPPVPTPSAPKAVNKTEKPLASLLAGTTAGAIEGFVTYPTEYAKTQLQFAAGKGGTQVIENPVCLSHSPSSKLISAVTSYQGPISILRETIANKGITGIYAGCSALVIGNAVKAGVRFLSYDQYKALLRDENVSRSS